MFAHSFIPLQHTHDILAVTRTGAASQHPQQVREEEVTGFTEERFMIAALRCRSSPRSWLRSQRQLELAFHLALMKAAQ